MLLWRKRTEKGARNSALKDAWDDFLNQRDDLSVRHSALQRTIHSIYLNNFLLKVFAIETQVN